MGTYTTCTAYILPVQSPIPTSHLLHAGYTGSLLDMSADDFLPSLQDMNTFKDTLSVLFARLLTKHIHSLSFLSSVVPEHIPHKYLNAMAKSSTVAVIDVLTKNKAESKTC